MSSAPPTDLSAIPEDQRDAVLAVLRERDALRDANKRLEHLVAELNQAVHGKRSEKLSEDERQLAFEDLETAVAEAETQQDEQAPPQALPRRAARRNRGNLPKDLPRIEQVIDPDSLAPEKEAVFRLGEWNSIRVDVKDHLILAPVLLRGARLQADHDVLPVEALGEFLHRGRGALGIALRGGVLPSPQGGGPPPPWHDSVSDGVTS